MPAVTQHPEAGTSRRTKVKALLAGGLVLGVGATATLAAWTDQAFVEGIFGTSSFNIQVSTDGGTTWVEADQDAGGDAATLAFDLPLSGDLQPADTVFAPASLRTDTTSLAADVTLQGATLATTTPAGSQALFDALVYTVAVTDTCTAAGVAAAPKLVTSAPLTTGSAAGAIDLAARAGNVVDLCFAVTLPAAADDATLQGLSATALWRFYAESVG